MIGIECADIYLRFPEIMEEEFEDLTEFIEDNHIRYEGATDIVYDLKKENEILKHRLNDMVFGDDYELGARYLRKIGYIDFDEKRKVYINKHNNEPFYHHDEKEKDYYIKDDELNEYTESLEYKLKKIEEYVDSRNDIPIEVVINIKNIINGGENNEI